MIPSRLAQMICSNIKFYTKKHIDNTHAPSLPGNILTLSSPHLECAATKPCYLFLQIHLYFRELFIRK